MGDNKSLLGFSETTQRELVSISFEFADVSASTSNKNMAFRPRKAGKNPLYQSY